MRAVSASGSIGSAERDQIGSGRAGIIAIFD
jgi:hypothetical protein